MNVQQSDLNDPALVTEVDLARAAAQEEAGDERVGEYVAYHVEDNAAVTHLFEADKPGYRGWRWAVTITTAALDADVTVSEVVLLPGPSALVAPDWIPWQNRVQAGDLGVGDLLPTSPDDPRLVPAYAETDDPDLEETAMEVGLGRVRVMSRPARLEAADRWHQSEYGPRSDMARSAPAHCGTCGFYLPLAGSLRAAFGTCGNELSPADAHVVHAEYGCGAHSEAEVEQVSPVLVADLIYDDAQLDVEPLAPAPGEADPSEDVEPAAVQAEIPDSSPAGTAVSASVETLEPTEAVEPASVDAPGSDPVEVVEPGPVATGPASAEAVEPSPVEVAEPRPADSSPVEGPVEAEAVPAEALDSSPAESVEAGPVEAVEPRPAEGLDSSPVEAAPAEAVVAPSPAEADESDPADAIDSGSALASGPAEAVHPAEALDSGPVDAPEPSPTAALEPEAPSAPEVPDSSVDSDSSPTPPAPEPAEPASGEVVSETELAVSEEADVVVPTEAESPAGIEPVVTRETASPDDQVFPG